MSRIREIYCHDWLGSGARRMRDARRQSAPQTQRPQTGRGHGGPGGWRWRWWRRWRILTRCAAVIRTACSLRGSCVRRLRRRIGRRRSSPACDGRRRNDGGGGGGMGGIRRYVTAEQNDPPRLTVHPPVSSFRRMSETLRNNDDSVPKVWPFEEAAKVAQRLAAIRQGPGAVRDRLRSVRPAAYRHVRRGGAHVLGAARVHRRSPACRRG